MEANLNQFRLFTVHAEQQANDRRTSRFSKNMYEGSGTSSSGNRNSIGQSGDPSGSCTDHDRRPSGGERDESPRSSPAAASATAPTENGSPGSHARHRRRCHGGRTGTAPAAGVTIALKNGKTSTPGCHDDSDNDVESTADESWENNEDDAGDVGNKLAEKSLIGALRSLERTVNSHCQLLGRRLTREPTVKGGPTSSGDPSGVGRAAVSGSAIPKSSIRGDKVTVYIRVVFLKIGEIDTLKENFMADAFIQARWREPALDNLSSQFQSMQHIEDIDWEKFWNPKLYVENNLGEPKETIWQTLMFNSRGEATVYERRRIKGCFLENLELDEFPFDTQDLTLTITTERSESEVDLEEDCSEISSINVQSFVDEQEWKLHSHVETWKRVSSKAYQNTKHKHPAFSTSCRASRRPGFFIWNIFLVMLFICSLTFATFSVDLSIPQSRLQLSFILLLTTITFKFVVSQTLPRISYLTYLDKYILTSMAILCGVCVWHAVVPSFVVHGNETAKIIDMWGLIVSGSTYFLFHICFFMYIYFVALKKRRTYDQKDRDYRERMKKLQRIQEAAGLDGGSPPAEAVSTPVVESV